MTAGPALRWSRAALLSAVAMGSGVVGHLAAGGLLPAREALVVLFAVCLVTAASLLGRPASVGRVVVLVVAGQTFIHGSLTAMSGHRGDPPLTRSPVPRAPVPAVDVPTAGGRRVGSLYEQVYGSQPGATRTELSVPAPVQHLLSDLTGPHAVMALAHLVAAVVVGLWLASGERALWRLLELSADGARELLARTIDSHHDQLADLARVGNGNVSRHFVPIVWRTPGPTGVSRLARVVVRRGPPALLAA